MALIKFLPGDGTTQTIDVKYIASGGMVSGEEGRCAYCNGDPCAEDNKDTPIGEYFKRNSWAETCPLCEGRPP